MINIMLHLKARPVYVTPTPTHQYHLIPIGRYVSKSASTAYAEQEAAKMSELEDLYDYEETGSGCRPCESESPRFFFAVTQEEDMNDLPCCSEGNSSLITPEPVTRR